MSTESHCEIIPTGKTEELGQNPFTVPLCPQNSNMDRAGCKPGPPQWHASD